MLEIPTPVHGRAVVRRDFRTEFGEKTKEGHEKSGIPMLDVLDMEHAKFTTSYEMGRLLSGKSITALTSGERHIVEVSCGQLLFDVYLLECFLISFSGEKVEDFT